MKKPLPTVSQIREVKHLHSTRLFGPATIAKLTGVRLRDVFRITRLPEWVRVAPDGTILAGQHRLLAMLQADAQ